MLEVVQMVVSIDDDEVRQLVENAMAVAGLKTVVVDAYAPTSVGNAGAEMLQQIADQFLNPTQIHIVDSEAIERLQRSDALLRSLGRDMSDPAAYDGYPPVLIVTDHLGTPVTRPNVFSVDEFVGMPASKLRDLFFTDDSVQ